MMLNHITNIIDYNGIQFGLDIKEYFIELEKEKKNIKFIPNKNNFFYNPNNNTYADKIIELFNIYKIAKQRYGGIYFLTKNIYCIEILYKNILNHIDNPKLLISILKSNLRDFKINGKINVFKDIEYIKYLFVEEKIFLVEDLTTFNIEVKLKEENNILNIFDISFDKIKKNNGLLKLLTERNVTTIFNRNDYILEESVKRIKRDFQKSIIQYIYINNYNYTEDDNITNIIKKISDFMVFFGKNIMQSYINDYIYFLYTYKNISKIEIIAELNHFLIEIEKNILEDYYIINNKNKDLFLFIRSHFAQLIKYSIIGEKDDFPYIDNDKFNNTIKNFFNYSIYY